MIILFTVIAIFNLSREHTPHLSNTNLQTVVVGPASEPAVRPSGVVWVPQAAEPHPGLAVGERHLVGNPRQQGAERQPLLQNTILKFVAQHKCEYIIQMNTNHDFN